MSRLEPFDDRRVVVDDLVDDRPQHRRRALLEQLRALLEPQPRAVQVAGHALAHGDDEPRPDEDRHLAELDLLALVDVARRAQHDERDPALVALDLRPQVEALRVLDRQLVQPELQLHALELLRRRLDHAEPDEAGVVAADRRRLRRLHLPGVLAATVAVVRAVDDHGLHAVFQRRLRAVREVRDAAELGDLQRAPERAPGGATTASRTQRLASANSTCSPALPRNASPERSTIAGPGRERQQQRLDLVGVGAVDLAGQPGDRHRAGAVDLDARRPGRHPRRRDAAGAGQVADADRRPVGALVDVDRVHQRAHDRRARGRATPGSAGGGRQRPRSRTTSVSPPPGSRASATSTAASLPAG